MALWLPGHALIVAGAAFASPWCQTAHCGGRRHRRLDPDETLAGGHALCECGAESEHLLSKRERQTWHRLHKQAVVDSGKPWVVGGLRRAVAIGGTGA